MFYVCSINLCGRFVALPDLLTLGICSVIDGLCSVLAEASTAGVLSCMAMSDSSAVEVAGNGIDDETVGEDKVDSKGIGSTSGCCD